VHEIVTRLEERCENASYDHFLRVADTRKSSAQFCQLAVAIIEKARYLRRGWDFTHPAGFCEWRLG
jgi:hypothetical protein